MVGKSQGQGLEELGEREEKEEERERGKRLLFSLLPLFYSIWAVGRVFLWNHQ